MEKILKAMQINAEESSSKIHPLTVKIGRWSRDMIEPCIKNVT